MNGGAVTSEATRVLVTALARGEGNGATRCLVPTLGGGWHVPSCSIPGPCFIHVSECPSNEPFGSAPMAPAMQPQLSLPFPWGRGLSSPGGHWPWPQWAKGSETPSLGAALGTSASPGEGCTASGSTPSSSWRNRLMGTA